MNRRSVSIARGGLLALPALGAAGVLAVYGVDVPVGDDWNTPGDQLWFALEGRLAPGDFLRQHNESRPAVSALVGTLTAWAFGWHPPLLMMLSWCLAGMTGLLLLRLLARTAGEGVATLPAALLFQLLLYSPAQVENQLWGVALVNFVPGACLAAALVWMQRAQAPAALFLGCAALSALATYAFASGMVLWLMCWPAPWLWLRRRAGSAGPADATLVRWSIVYAGIAACVLFVYFAGFERTPGLASAADTAGAPGRFVAYLCAWLGLLVGAREDALAFVQAVGACLVLSLGVLAASSLRSRDDRWSRLAAVYPWAVCAIYAVGMGVGATAIRSQLGPEAALAGRYVTTAVWLPIGLAGGAVALGASRGTGRALQAGIALLIALASVGWVAGLASAPDHRAGRLQAALTLRFVEAIPDDPLLVRIYPRPELVRQRVPGLREAGLLPAVGVDGDLAGALRVPPTHDAPSAVGGWRADRVVQGLRLSGEARLPEGGVPAEAVLVAAIEAGGGLRPITVLRQRSDGFDPRFAATLPIRAGAGERHLRVYAFDLASARLHVLPGPLR